MQEISKTYDPKKVEEKWYHYWNERNYFYAPVDEEKEPFCIVMPPPNVTGSLHLGHALDNTLQDILIRWRRMQGYNALWVPGTDHAGIATQARVEEELAKEGLSKYDLGREKFLERVWDWKHQYGNKITSQLRLLGSSCDWSRERFTMDEGCSRAVREVFVRLYKKGLIYRGNYIINWCPKCQTTISDIEVEHQEREGNLWHIRYPVKDSDEYIVVATTRPETMLGDTAVAVHPEDERYQHLIGRSVILPVVGREIPIIADEYVDPEFGSGAVKITPAHDPNDFEIALRHNLPFVVVIDKNARMTKEAGKYQGMERYECRKQLLEQLKEEGFLVNVEDYSHAVGQCYRCDTIIEPLVSEQWFVKMKPLAEPAIRAVKEGRIRFVPERFTKIYLNWMENIRDWCISRQLWWGHRIPVWYCQECGEIICETVDPDKCSKCGSSELVQDPDVLDTWFSSALWPFSTLGWPERTPELNYFYPTNVLVTGRDIIFFWVARMIFMSLEFMKEVPFREVFIHGLVLDAQGRKMSKSLGNGVDPIEVIDQYGADTLRFMLVTGNTPGNDLRFHFERLEGVRNFCNKIWNASRFAVMNLSDYEEPEEVSREYTLADRWILSRYSRTVKEVTRLLEKYELGEAARILYEFIWTEFCDWYIELIKPRLYGKESPESRRTAQYVLNYVLGGTMRLLHPFMPFITEEIWHHLPQDRESIMIASWPEDEPEREDREAEQKMELLMNVIRAVRNLRSEMNVPPNRQAEVILAANSAEALKILEEGMSYLKNLANAAPVTLRERIEEKPAKAATAVENGIEIFMPLEGLIDIDREVERLEKELAEVKQELERVKKKLSNEGFLSKAPREIVDKEKAKKLEFERKQQILEQRLSMLKG
ncbi:valine--tRNA ligase [Calderihabitans maritimus]|uniref:Valine--tRNA ligase n=1 Tax=Calderihabitans maritimus TaxID=1246530 RepID=A0A1Z5HUX4_9FIRM|nr:valine--tRNA ligase [Calderihabitans maritimus]GAW93314.1 valyl-tRNA synthetase [Calderihabitans maritimus]